MIHCGVSVLDSPQSDVIRYILVREEYIIIWQILCQKRNSVQHKARADDSAQRFPCVALQWRDRTSLLEVVRQVPWLLFLNLLSEQNERRNNALYFTFAKPLWRDRQFVDSGDISSSHHPTHPHSAIGVDPRVKSASTHVLQLVLRAGEFEGMQLHWACYGPKSVEIACLPSQIFRVVNVCW